MLAFINEPRISSVFIMMSPTILSLRKVKSSERLVLSPTGCQRLRPIPGRPIHGGGPPPGPDMDEPGGGLFDPDGMFHGGGGGF